MKHKILIFGFVVQFLLIGVMFMNAYLPVFFGTQVKVRAFGYDPRDLLAGNFIRLNYNISFKDEHLFPHNEKDFFILLDDSDKDGIFEFGEVLSQKPQNKLYVKARYKNYRNLQIGVEKYFVSKKRAIELEKSLNLAQNTAIVTLKIHKGKARIVGFELENKVILPEE